MDPTPHRGDRSAFPCDEYSRVRIGRGSGLPRWAAVFPFVNGGLFADAAEAPRFSRIARSYLLHIGSLDWKKINPDIFGSMVQAVAVKEERGNLGMHYTSVPNILKVLNPPLPRRSARQDWSAGRGTTGASSSISETAWRGFGCSTRPVVPETSS